MSRWWLVLAFVSASAVATAQPAPTTDRAVAAVSVAQQQVGALDARWRQLEARYQDQLAAIDRLKKERASWRRDRELRDDLASSNDTAGQLAALARQRAAAQDAAASARRAAVVAIDVELAAGATEPRASQLHSLRSRLAPPARAPTAIHLPSTEVDPLADAGELEQQAAQIRATEQQLEAQAIGLDHEAKELEETAAVRKQHDRATTLAMRDDDQPLHGTQTVATHGTGGNDTISPTGGGAGSGSGGGGEQGGPGTPAPGSDPFAGDRGTTGSFDDATVVLGHVIDRATLEGLARASRSGDPAQRAEAARRARDAVRAKLEQLRKQRALIEARAKQLRD